MLILQSHNTNICLQMLTNYIMTINICKHLLVSLKNNQHLQA